MNGNLSGDDRRVAVIGAGPGGLVTARWLASHGLEPVLFEAADAPGGQWNPGAPTSAVWKGMRTNTSRVMSAFSDLDHPPGTATYPRAEEMRAYLDAYARLFDLPRRMRLGTAVEGLAREADGGWLLRSRGRDGVTEERFPRVVVATGAQAVPALPEIPGMAGFAGNLGVLHASRYGGASRFRGRSVVVSGCSISALEIASDLAGTAEVISAYRRQRYVLPKLIAGVPTEHAMFTRAAALAAETMPPERLEAALREAVLRAGGSPERFGARAPDPDILVAGITQSQGFLPAVAEGRIAVKPWISRIEGRRVTFDDGTAAEPDAVILGTGYRPSLPFLSDELRGILMPAEDGPDLFAHTFHPALPGLAFVGLFNLVGPYFPVLKLQARWIALRLAGRVAMPPASVVEAGMAEARAMRRVGADPVLHLLAVRLARLAGVEPEPEAWPGLERALLFGPLSPVSFRLQGPDALPDAPARVRRAAASFGAIEGEAFTPEEAAMRASLLPPRGLRAA